MTPFLQQIADHYYNQDGLDGMCFIFPNRRSISFFRKYLSRNVAADGSKPIIAPHLLTINDFFFKVSERGQCDKTSLILKLYDCYKTLNPKAEPLDDFLFWGDILLSDFDDIDKYRVNAQQLFANVNDLKSIQDTFEYLTPTQREAIERFAGHFRTGGRIKESFLQIWSILWPLYKMFRLTLSEQGIAYEGQAYREFAESDESVVDTLGRSFKGCRKFVFAGLNALNECEKTVLRKMRNAGIAEFCWDYSSELIKDRDNRSSFFMRENVIEFPQAFEPDPDGLPQGRFNIISIPSRTGQAKLLPGILSSLPGIPDIGTAVVLPDEDLLLPVLNSIPPQVEKLNVTMGYPMSGSSLWSLMDDIAGLQMRLRYKDGKWWFYHKQVWAIFSNSIFKTVATEQDNDVVNAIKAKARYYIPQDEITLTPLLSGIFSAVVTDAANADGSIVKALQEYQLQLISTLAPLLKDAGGMELEMDFAREYHLAINRLHNMDLKIKASSYFSLLDKIMHGSSIPFEGEPLNGMQIMGPLETRALDFENLIILSCNEGSFPRHSVSSSFIPPELRKGFGLPTYEFQDAVWAYYFYRMIQRAGNVWMIYNSGVGGLQSGEESRYIKQLELHFGIKPVRMAAVSQISSPSAEPDPVKTAGHIRTLHEGHLSASALQNYLSCPAKFYYSSVCGLREKNEVSESLDSGMFGNVFHKCMQRIYQDRPEVGIEYLAALSKDIAGIQNMVEEEIRGELKSFEVSGRNIIYRNVIVKYIQKTLSCDIELLQRNNASALHIYGTEKFVRADIGGFRFVGVIDRLDGWNDSEIRVVDYKTGQVSDNDFIINEGNAADVVEALFGPDDKNRPKIALQLYLYDVFVSGMQEAAGKRTINSIYQPSRLFVKGIEHVSTYPEFTQLMAERLQQLLDEISDLSIPWTRKTDETKCGYCAFKTICGR